MSWITHGRFERTLVAPVRCTMRRARGWVGRVPVALVFVAFMAGPAVKPAEAQKAQKAWTADAMVGSSFANIGTTFVASGSARVPLNDFVSIVGEAGMLPWAPFDKAEPIRAPMPTLVADADRRVNVYHFNANAQLNLFGRARPGLERWRPYVTLGVGPFIADSVATGALGETNVRTRRRETNLATNLGGGVGYRLLEWMDLNGEFRTFYVHREGMTPRVYRVTAGVSFLLRK